MIEPKDEPILIRCAGSTCPPNTNGTCTMCGRYFGVLYGLVSEHQRDDIIARLNRGDFNPGPQT